MHRVGVELRFASHLNSLVHPFHQSMEQRQHSLQLHPWALPATNNPSLRTRASGSPRHAGCMLTESLMHSPSHALFCPTHSSLIPSVPLAPVPSRFHSLHHTSLTYNFSLHLPIYDYLGGRSFNPCAGGPPVVDISSLHGESQLISGVARGIPAAAPCSHTCHYEAALRCLCCPSACPSYAHIPLSPSLPLSPPQSALRVWTWSSWPTACLCTPSCTSRPSGRPTPRTRWR